MNSKLLLSLVLVCLVTVPSFSQKRSPARNASTSPVKDASDISQILPIRRVILYSNGVAYIERRGVVSGNTEINLSFKQSQVDDVLKSMVVLDLGSGKIGAVSYNSSLPASARTAEIPFSVNAQTTNAGGIAGVLSQLQGAKVAVTTGKGTVTGSILTVEKRQSPGEKDRPPTTSQFLIVASDNGEIFNFDLGELRSVKLLEDDTRKDISEFATATASTRRRDAKTITVTSQGTGQREMLVSYTIAAPIWKTTYRVVLDDEGKPFFQGWAIVDNVSDEDWQNVKLSLISGTPISFIQPIQKPMYRYRPVVPVPQDLNLQPQVYEEGVSAVAGAISGTVYDPNGAVIPNVQITIRNNATGQTFNTTSNSSGSFTTQTLASGNYTISAYAPGFKTTQINGVAVAGGAGRNLNMTLEIGSINETVSVDGVINTANASLGNTIAANQITQLPLSGRNSQNLLSLQAGAQNNFSVSETSVSDALTGNRGGVTTAATGEELGDLFEYRIEQPITVLRDRSALIPIVQTKMDGERIAIYNESVRRDRPMGGMLLTNTSNLTFEGGSLTVIDRDAYAGEALMERLKPKERRLISFALDLGTLLSVENREENEPAKLVRVVNGMFQVHYFRSSRKIYKIANQTDKVKTLYIESPIRTGWVLSPDTPKPDITTNRYYRFRIELKAFQNTELVVSEQQALMDNYQISTLTGRDLELFISRRYIDEATRNRLERLIQLRTTVGQLEAKLNNLENEETNIASDQKRLRENIEALSKTPEAKTLITRYIEKVNSQETRLEEIQKERNQLNAEIQRLNEELAREISAFELK